MSTPTAPPGPSPIPIKQFVDELRKHHEKEGHTAAHIAGLVRILDDLLRLDPGMTTVDLAAPDLEDRYLAARPEGEGPRTRRKAKDGLRAVRRLAHRLGRVGPLPVLPSFPKERRAKAPQRDLSPADVEMVRAHLRGRVETWEDQRLLILFELAAGTDLLRRELLSLEWADFDWKNRTIAVRRRERFRRGGPATVEIPDRLLPDLRAWKAVARTRYVFPGKAGRGHWNSYYSGTGLEPAYRLKEAGRAVGVEGVTFEALRRSYLDRGTPGPVPGARPLPMLPASQLPRRRPVAATLAAGDVTRLVAYLVAHAATWEGHRDLAVFGLILLDGLSLRSVLNLEVGSEDFDRAAGTIRLIGTSGRRHAFSPEAAALVAGWLGRADQVVTPWMFPGPMLLGPWGRGDGGEDARDRLLEIAGTLQLGHVTPLSLSRFHGSHRGRRAELLEVIGSTDPPAPILGGPCPRPTGPTPKGGRTRHRVAPWAHRALAAAPAPATEAVRWEFEDLVVLGDLHHVPPVVLGVEMAPLTEERYRVMRALLEAGPDGLDEAGLRHESGCNGARKLLKKLAEDPRWGAILRFPGQGRRLRYRLAPPGDPMKY